MSNIGITSLTNPPALLNARFFTYGTVHNSVAIGGSDTQNIQVQGQVFIWVMTMFSVTTTVNLGAPKVLLQIVDTGIGETVFDRPVPVWSVAGSGTDPFYLPLVRAIAPNSSIQVTVTNKEAAIVEVRLTLGGYRGVNR